MHSYRYPWDETKTWENASDEVRKAEVSRLKEKGWSIEKIAYRIGTSVEEIEKYISD